MDFASRQAAMDWQLAAFAVAPAVVLWLQGVGCLRGDRPPFVRWFGALAIALAGLDGVLAGLLLTGTLVPSTEFASVMVKGTLPYFGLVALQLGLPVIAGLGWHVARMAAGQTSRLFGLLLAALLVGGSAVWGLETLNPDYPAHARVYVHNLLWPPLLLWIGLCFFESCYAVLRLHSRLWRTWANCSLVIAPALWAVGAPWVVDDVATRMWWWACLVVFLPLSTGLGTWLLLATRAPGPPLRRALVLSGASAVVGLVTAGLWLWVDVRPVPGWLVWPVFPVLVGALGLRAAWRAHRAQAVESVRPPVRLRQALSFVALVVIAGSFAELVYFGFLDPLVPLIVFIVAWTVLAEATARGFLTTLGQLAISQRLWATDSPVRLRIDSALTAAASTWTGAWNALRAAVAMPTVSVAVVKFVVIVLGLIVLAEVPNAGRTVIEPFTTQVAEPGAPQVPVIGLGQQISDRVLNTVALITQALRPDAVRLLPRGVETKPVFMVSGASAGGASLDAAFAKGNELDLGYVKVPATFVLGITRDPVRAVLGVRVITGTVQAGPHRYVLLARASTGETWRLEPKPFLTNGPAPPPADVVDELASRLAFQIIASTDRTMRMAGLTHSWEAFETFERGLKHWQQFETGHRLEDLASAIRDFREATHHHPSFAFAFYRLGLALQRDGQPSAAADALRASLRINENLIPAYLALASTLYDHDGYLAFTPAPAASPELPVSSAGQVFTRRAEARGLWLHVIVRPPYTISGADRASAFYGLCRVALHAEEFGGGEDAHDRLRRLAYYYCRRAERLYATLPLAERANASIKDAEASVLHDLGRLFVRRTRQRVRVPVEGWHCRGAQEVSRGPLHPLGLGYLERAEALTPANDVIRCRAASVAAALGRPEKMKALEVDALARVALAERWVGTAKGQPDRLKKFELYRRALEEYSQAIKLNPTLFEALNGFAYTFWELRLLGPDDPEAAKFAESAETYARQAVKVADERRSKDDTNVARATLGEVLLAQARPQEAIEHLTTAHAGFGKHVSRNEMRWDLAQAYLCAATNDSATGVPKAEAVQREQAIPLLEAIRQSEETREWRPFSADPQTLDPTWDHKVCLRNPTASVDIRPNGGPLYRLLDGGPRYERHEVCDRMGVAGWVHSLPPGEGLAILHVWGGGVNRRIPVNVPNLSVQLDSPRKTRHYYFAQLEDSDGRPISEVYPLATYAEEGGRCARNLIRMVFVSGPR